MFLQPGLTDGYLTGVAAAPTAVTDWAYHHASAFVAAGMVLTGLFLLRHRPRAVEAAPLVWLVVYVVNPNFFLQYVVWGLPFFLLVGWLREVAVLQVVLLPVAVLTYRIPCANGAVMPVYVTLMTAVWMAWVALLVRTGWTIARGGAEKRVRLTQPVLTATGAASTDISERRRR